ncbi:MAG TPA: pentapeptide repeat-containing protein [Candidatus Bariatricus faecipullorum]|nr:pentapeptide repeat-containing protein [Candidatus Bariatricus faecipullorum]
MPKKLKKEELARILRERPRGLELDLRGVCLEDMNLAGWDMHNVNLEKASICRVKLDGADLSWAKAVRVCFQDSSFRNCRFSGALLREADFRGASLAGADISGADMFGARLYRADLTGIRWDDRTKFFRMYCPEKGAFLAWKVCFNRKIVLLYIPEEAARVSGTTNEVRCDRAKVVSIRSIDGRERFTEAHSYVDENFVYREGEMVYAKNFNPARFIESGGGIHVWMTREEAVAYMG